VPGAWIGIEVLCHVSKVLHVHSQRKKFQEQGQDGVSSVIQAHNEPWFALREVFFLPFIN
jgi:hypothetical protein